MVTSMQPLTSSCGGEVLHRKQLVVMRKGFANISHLQSNTKGLAFLFIPSLPTCMRRPGCFSWGIKRLAICQAAICAERNALCLIYTQSPATVGVCTSEDRTFLADGTPQPLHQPLHQNSASTIASNIASTIAGA